MKRPRLKPVTPQTARNALAAISLVAIAAGLAGFDVRVAAIVVGGLVFYLTIKGMRHA